MSTHELEALENEEKELQEKLEAIKKKKLDIVNNDGKVIIEVTGIQNFGYDDNRITVKNDSDSNLINLYKSIPGHYFSFGENYIFVKEWLGFLDKLAELNNGSEKYKINYGNKVAEEKIAELIKVEQAKQVKLATLPNITISLSKDGKSFEVVAQHSYQHIFSQMSGINYNSYHNILRIPVAHAAKIYQKTVDIKKVEWSDAAKKLAYDELAIQTKLDEVGLKARSNILDDIITEMSPYWMESGFYDPITKVPGPRDFQTVGVEFLDITGGNAIIGDQMGLGKSCQFILYKMLMERRYKFQGRTDKYKAIVMCPASLKLNWLKEIKKIANRDDVVVLRGDIPTAHDIVTLMIDKPDWVIINYDILGNDMEVKKDLDKKGDIREAEKMYPWVALINKAQYDLIGTDEAHYYKNVGSKRSKATLKLECKSFVPLTGTPILNRPGELWPMLNLTRPNLFPFYETFLREFTYNNGKSAKNVAELREIMKSIMIRRTKKEVLKDLPPINRVRHWMELDAKTLKVYEKVEAGVFEILKEWDPSQAGAEKEIPNLLAKINRLKQVAAIGKTRVTADLAVELSDSSSDENGKGDKVIIFTQFKRIAYGIANMLGHEALTMTGDDSLSDREKIKHRFKTDNSIKFLVGVEKVLGEGHNLEEAWYVIFNDLFWTPGIHAQCEERAYGRLSNAHHIDAYYVLASKEESEPTIDTWIMNLLESKIALINEVTEGYSVDRNASILKDLLKKMKEEMRRR